jgi:hypothetical protein
LTAALAVLFLRVGRVVGGCVPLARHSIMSEKLTQENIATRLGAAKRRKAEALAGYEAASAEVAWLEEGVRLFGGDAEPDSQTSKEILTEVFPEGFVFDQGITPSLRQAMVVVMREQPGRRGPWPI